MLKKITHFKRYHPYPLIPLTDVCFSATNLRKNKEEIDERKQVYSAEPQMPNPHAAPKCTVLLAIAQWQVLTGQWEAGWGVQWAISCEDVSTSKITFSPLLHHHKTK